MTLEVGRFAWRTFSTAGHRFTLRLKSPYIGQARWEGGVEEARCYRDHPSVVPNYGLGLPELPEHIAPLLECSCGIYGSHALSTLTDQFSAARSMVAVMACEGDTIVGTRGLRTQFARIVGYVVFDSWPTRRRDTIGKEALLRLCEKQFPDAQHFDTSHDMAEAFHLKHTVAQEKSAGGSEWWMG